MSVSKLLPSSGSNDFNVTVTGTDTSVTFDKEYASGAYTINISGADSSFDTVTRQFELNRASLIAQNTFHPTEKPYKLYKWILDKYAKENDKILDTHLGSGSIAIACHDLGFELTACELDTDYFNAAMKRINDHKKQLKLI